MLRPALALLAVACTAPSAPGDKPPPSGRDTGAPPTTPTDPPTTVAGDVALVRALAGGDGDAEAVVDEVAASGGWPVHDGTTAWFVRLGGGDWSVAGDFDAWAGTAMTQGGGFSWAQVEVGADPAGQRYKFTDGAVYEPDVAARSYEYDAYGEISFVAPPSDRARLDRWFPPGRGEIGPRELRVWVPPGRGPWPTLYAMDGQNLFDPGAIWGGWRLPDALAGRDDVLVVGIDNTADRFEDYTHVPDDIGYGSVMGGDGDAYGDWVEDVVRPTVEGAYGASDLTGVMGSSLGGLISLVIAQDHPGRYDFVASLSGTLGWGRFGLDEETVEERWLRDPPTGAVVYVDSGGGPGGDAVCTDPDGDGFPEDDPDSSDNYCETRQFADALAGAGFTWDRDLFHWWEPGAQHNEAEWAARVGPVLDRFLELQ